MMIVCDVIRILPSRHDYLLVDAGTENDTSDDH